MHIHKNCKKQSICMYLHIQTINCVNFECILYTYIICTCTLLLKVCIDDFIMIL